MERALQTLAKTWVGLKGAAGRAFDDGSESIDIGRFRESEEVHDTILAILEVPIGPGEKLAERTAASIEPMYLRIIKSNYWR